MSAVCYRGVGRTLHPLEPARSVYLSDTYREVLKKRIAENANTRGYKTRIAAAAGCHNSYLSQVLGGTVDLTPEQAINLAAFWSFTADATDLFLDLLHRDRAGNVKLREFYERRLKKGRESHDTERASGPPRQNLPPDAESIFFSSWSHAAVLALAFTTDFADEERIAVRLCLPLALVREALTSLESMALIRKSAKGWVAGGSAFHLSRSAPLHATNHVNWRNRAIANVQNRDPDSLHLPHVGAMQRSEIKSIKAKLVHRFDGSRIAADGSIPEDGLALTIDLFRI
ncbi:MAG: DUF4423 domain-containing protein [Proteobacteria bacterium]|nr:MAG: DUF4423 domain-containing protein [Pseudomonadota bacterium]